MLTDTEKGCQRFEQGPYVVELTAQLLEFDVPIETGEIGVRAEIICSTTYDSIGGISSYTPKHLPMIPGNWYGLGGCGNPKTFLSEVARLTTPGSFPDKSTIEQRTKERQFKMLTRPNYRRLSS